MLNAEVASIVSMKRFTCIYDASLRKEMCMHVLGMCA